MRRAWGLRALGAAEWSALVAAALFMTFVGAFDTAQAPLLRRAAYWLVVMIGGGAIGGVIDGLLSTRLNASAQVRAALQVLAMTPPIVGLVLVASAALFSPPITLLRIAELIPAVLVVNVVLVCLAWLIRRGRRLPAPLSEAVPPPAIGRKLAPKLGRAELLAVQAEDHYLRVHTVAGAGLVLMRFSEALDALVTRDGYQSHRSWWVARGAVDQVRWGRGRGILTLRNGLRVPVSRSYFSNLRKADWAETSATAPARGSRQDSERPGRD